MTSNILRPRPSQQCESPRRNEVCPMCGQPVAFARGLCSEECLLDWQRLMDEAAGESIEDHDAMPDDSFETCGPQLD